MDPLQGLLQDFRRDRSAAAMEEIVRATRPRLLAVARRIGAREDAEDSVQAGGIGGHEAETALLAYIDGYDPSRTTALESFTPAIGYAIGALSKIDAAKARVRAEALLDDPTRKLSARDREILLEHAGRVAR